jgi:hypothetical protein
MSEIVPPAGASDEQIEQFIQSLRRDARARVKEMLANGAPEDEIVEYINSLESEPQESSIETSPSPQDEGA